MNLQTLHGNTPKRFLKKKKISGDAYSDMLDTTIKLSSTCLQNPLCTASSPLR